MRQNQKRVIAKKVLQKKTLEEKKEMLELAKKFIGKECLIYSFDSNHQFSGTIQEVSDGALLLEKNGEIEAVNLDFVIRIREVPKNKNGKISFTHMQCYYIFARRKMQSVNSNAKKLCRYTCLK